ncbi:MULTISPECIES: response regulator transcription factor [Olivibacter]|uniref:Response regulator transcription factor n=2 Tax=Olivibacter TaxID=376469 RepID=A0ABV6HHY2_9SPHI|nr:MULTISPECIES: response regulator transcription factor [Olivibacter]MCL4638378.1 response regulator transcription factor [Olivibacter sp. UJ_SKK_5.1]MDX3912494.1 response regulator transcription factor [Pseudosphingobacterium sp.]QEL00213.1 response regulator transcription factor [Olivibacter sp. LS-1]
MVKILLIEDDRRLASFIRKGLEEQLFSVKCVSSGYEALAVTQDIYFDLIILDIMLPDVSGFQICTAIRERKITSPLIILSALDNPEEKVKGLQAGADDYLGKPFHFEELLARINAQLRRKSFEKGILDVQKYADLEVNIAEQGAKRAGKNILLSPREYKLLLFLLNNRERVVSRTQIAEAVWDIHFNTHTNVVDVYINYLRNKIDKGFAAPLIHTVKGRGYMLKQKEE